MYKINVLNSILIVMNLLVVPYFSGFGLLHMLGIEKAERKMVFDKLEFSIRHGLRIFAGMLLSMSVFLIAAIPITWFKGSFYAVLWITLGTSLFFLIYGIERMYIIKKKCTGSGDKEKGKKTKSKNGAVGRLLYNHKEEALLLVICLAVVIYYIVKTITKVHFDEDDSRYIVNAVDTLKNGKLLATDPTTGGPITEFYGDFKKDLISPWYGYIAYLACISFIHPTVLAHTVMPVIYTLIIALLMFDMGKLIFNGDISKTSVFVTFMFVLYIFGASSRTSMVAMKAYRLWQGKAMVASFGLPLMILIFILLYDLDKKEMGIKWLLLLFANMSLSLMSGNGLVLSAVLTACFGIIYAILKKNWKILLWTVLTVLPNVLLFILSEVLTISKYIS